MINERVQSMFHDFNPVNEPTIEVTINFTPGKMVEDLANALMYELVRVAGPTGEFMLRDLDVEGIRKYLCTLSWMRRARITGLNNKATVLYRSLSRSAACPVLWYQVLVGIGVATDRDYSIRFIPGNSIDGSDLLAPEEMQTISDIMFRLQNCGFKVVAGVPQSEEGELDFMAMSHVEELVLSYRKSHPVYGFMASFFATKEVSEALGALVRIRYGYESDYKVLLTKVVASMGGEGS